MDGSLSTSACARTPARDIARAARILFVGWREGSRANRGGVVILCQGCAALRRLARRPRELGRARGTVAALAHAQAENQRRASPTAIVVDASSSELLTASARPTVLTCRPRRRPPSPAATEQIAAAASVLMSQGHQLVQRHPQSTRHRSQFAGRTLEEARMQVHRRSPSFIMSSRSRWGLHDAHVLELVDLGHFRRSRQCRSVRAGADRCRARRRRRRSTRSVPISREFADEVSAFERQRGPCVVAEQRRRRRRSPSRAANKRVSRRPPRRRQAPAQSDTSRGSTTSPPAPEARRLRTSEAAKTRAPRSERGGLLTAGRFGSNAQRRFRAPVRMAERHCCCPKVTALDSAAPMRGGRRGALRDFQPSHVTALVFLAQCVSIPAA